jgi:hypothetical protein
MRLRDHNKADLALAALTLGVSAAAVGSETVRWAARRRVRHVQRPPAAVASVSKQHHRP